MKKFLLSLALMATASAAFAPSADAWWDFGHKTITELAQRHLNPKTASRIESILGNTITTDASWFDDHRKDPGLEYAFQWHNFIVDDKTGDLDPNWGFDGNNAIFGLFHIENLLKNFDNLDLENQKLVIRMVIHFMGDAHCPAHCWFNKYGLHVQRWNVRVPGYQFSEKTGDVINFHGFYDRMPEFNHPGKTPSELAEILDIAKKGEIRKIQKGTPFDWCHEMMKDCKFIYELNPPKEPYDKTVVIETTTKTIDLSKSLSDKCLRKGGYRLAWWLNQYIK